MAIAQSGDGALLVWLTDHLPSPISRGEDIHRTSHNSRRVIKHLIVPPLPRSKNSTKLGRKLAGWRWGLSHVSSAGLETRDRAQEVTNASDF